MKKKNDGHRDAYWHSVQILFAAEKRAADLCLRMQLGVGQAQMNREPLLCADAKHGATGVATKPSSIISFSIMQQTGTNAGRSVDAYLFPDPVLPLHDMIYSPIGLTSE